MNVLPIMNKSKVLFFILNLLLPPWSAEAQTNDSTGLKFTVITELPHTSVKNQSHSQTCWSFAGLSFLESEMLRKGKPEVDLSEMFIVNHCYLDKGQKFIRMKGHTNFGPGGIFYDLLYVIRNYGLVPEQVYHGINYNQDIHDHTIMDSILRKEVETAIGNKSSVISMAWPDTLKKTLNSYLGEMPENFTYQDKNYTPKTFVSDYCNINPDDYVQITSFTHHPFYKPFRLEIPDNWLWSDFYNVPLDEMEQIIDNSLKSGYTVAWAADVSEKGFNTTNKGIAVVPVEMPLSLTGAETSERNIQTIYENEITPEIRQAAFDDQETTDDHGMHIIGLAKDQSGKEYYIVKNSWGDYNGYKGYFYASKSYIRYKTTGLMVNKSAIPDTILSKLGL